MDDFDFDKNFRSMRRLAVGGAIIGALFWIVVLVTIASVAIYAINSFSA